MTDEDTMRGLVLVRVFFRFGLGLGLGYIPILGS